MSIESKINLAVGRIQSAVKHGRNHNYDFSEQEMKQAIYELTVAREELRTLRAIINKLEGNL